MCVIKEDIFCSYIFLQTGLMMHHVAPYVEEAQPVRERMKDGGVAQSLCVFSL